MKEQPFVISYARYSSMAQREGTSLERQAEYAQRWADANGMELNRTLRDQGVSAFKGRHAQKGELGSFLRDVDAGKVPRGSVLVVEGLDRLSREKVLTAFGQFTQIVSKGITIVTAKDGMVFNEKTIKENQGSLFMSMGVMMRANEESETKANRGRDAIRLRAQAWIGGDRSKRVNAGSLPSWLRKDGKGGFELEPEYAHATRTAVDLYMKGYSLVATAKELTERGLKLTPRGSQNTQVERLVSNQALIGTHVVEVSEPEKPVERFVLEGYYPPLLKVAQWHALQDAIKARSAPAFSNKGTLPHVLTGFGATLCGYCRCAIVSQVYSNAKRGEGALIADAYRRVRCSHYSRSEVTCKAGGHSVRAAPLERAVMEFGSDLMNLRSLHGGDRSAAPQAALETAREREAEITEQLKQITQALKLAKDKSKLLTFVNAAADLEDEKIKAHAEVEAAQRALARVSRSDLNGVEAKFRKLAKGVLDQEPDARRQARQLIVENFEQIVLYSRGIRPKETPEGVMHLVLRAHGGAARILQIDEQGKWVVLSETYRPNRITPARKPADVKARKAA